jgi:hypothetical protein
LRAQADLVGVGVRLAVNGLFDAAALRTAHGSIVLGDHVPDRTAKGGDEAAGYVNASRTSGSAARASSKNIPGPPAGKNCAACSSTTAAIRSAGWRCTPTTTCGSSALARHHALAQTSRTARCLEHLAD